MTTPRCFYFGCWNEAGHYLFAPGGLSLHSKEDGQIQYYGPDRRHLDGSLAPRVIQPNAPTSPYEVFGRVPGETFRLCWLGCAPREANLEYKSGERPQGQFLRHELDSGFSCLQWWDRCQGDTRGACNSTILLEGRHTTWELLAALRDHFPHVLANLDKHGVELVEVTVVP